VRTLFLFALFTVIVSQEVGATEVLLVANNRAGTVSVIETKTFKPLCEMSVIPDLRVCKEIS